MDFGLHGCPGTSPTRLPRHNCIRAGRLCSRFAAMMKPGPTLKVVQVGGSPMKEDGHQAVRAIMMEMYKVSQLQTGGWYYFCKSDLERLYRRGDI